MPRQAESTAIVRGPRPEGTDGSDHAFRMIIENKYKRIAVLKKYNRILFYCHVSLSPPCAKCRSWPVLKVPLIVLLGIWSGVPVTVGLPYPYQAIIILLLEAGAIFAFYLAAIGQRKEWMAFVKVYGSVLAFLTAEHMLIRFWYHVQYPKDHLYPHLLSRGLAVGLMQNTDHLKMVLQVWEAMLDGALFFVLTAATFCCRSYVEEKRSPDLKPPSQDAAEAGRLKRD